MENMENEAGRGHNLPPSDTARFDTVVIGGGISGAAAARELAASGLSVLLLEAKDFASGTTSRTSRLQYCGLAYLAGFTRFRDIVRHPIQFLTSLRLARRSMIERRRFLSSHPHLLRPVPFQIPIFADEGPSVSKMALAMRMMAVLDPASPWSWRLLGAKEAKELPFMGDAPKPLAGAIVYLDYQYDWPERVCVEVLGEAKAFGATVRNYAVVENLSRDGTGWLITYKDRRTGQSRGVVASSVLNCAGPWVGELAAGSGLDVQKLNSGEKGANVMVRLPKRYRGQGLQVRTEEDGTFYIVPWNDLHYIGPVNTVMEVGDSDSFRVTDSDLKRFLDIAGRYLPTQDAEGLDPIFAWAGTRPRTRDQHSGGPAAMPRLHCPDETRFPGYFVYTGGLLMMHDSMGRECARAICRSLGRNWKKNRKAYGSLPSPHSRLELTRENVRWMVEQEQALTLEDILFRRTSHGWAEDMGISVLSSTADWLGEALGWSETDRNKAIAEYRNLIRDQFRATMDFAERYQSRQFVTQA